MALDLSSLQKAVGSLERAIRVSTKNQNNKAVDVDQEEVIRAGVIQNFEFTYELCWKFIKRWLELNASSATVIESITRKELFRRANASQLIDDMDNWMEYHEARNETSHIYNHDKAHDIFEVAKNFLNDAKQLLAILESKND